ncbi:GNAT family N-acetyltransferase [Ectobacillus sp. JY-23]|uniref:GNAT family N-acetyltransferase n=1 Tax=Ectobacillus sp. JY-23 TaxID=2933872 RepID=UPI001FF342E8|nr:GNAT family N-acetyltransferase [Ectobacillus sp. JY-23]UOY93415.1 GNAT family N-acetyltransferase [Ectobacillus sp. JY-23]
MKEIIIKKSAQVPMDLLLLADPSEAQIRTYLERGTLFIAVSVEQVVGAYILLETRPRTMEIMNIAVVDEHQGQGIGKQLLMHAIQMARRQGMYKLEIGTGNSSISQLALYQKSGFRMIGIEHNYFTRHYDEEIVENGIHCRDMIRLAIDL